MYLTTRKNNSLSEEQARGIHLDIEELLTKKHKIKIEANNISNGSSTLFWLDGFEKQLEEYKIHLLQEKNNIKKTIETQPKKNTSFNSKGKKKIKIAKRDEALAKEINQYNSYSAELKKQYKSHISALNKANTKKDKEIRKLSSTIFQFKNNKKNIKN
ncbi:30550_t:CDS:2 [Gigaspora margarita]|uniref:30550_t:CDS:1 n=1 Tax=Gigaspora margarita TaxID=4874 RepID=A0ABN7VZ12_GIGMA|nr:30550_t:CDS:2 [Gigaspora margarita]